MAYYVLLWMFSFFFFFFSFLVSHPEVNSGGTIDYKIAEAERTGIVICCPCVGV